MHKKNQNTCSFLRRLCAILYDTILLSSVLFFATFVLMPFLGGGAIDSNNFVYKIYLFLLTYLYFSWQWCFGGKTLGMRSWKIKIVNESEIKPNFQQATKRFLASALSLILLGSGFLWAIFDKNKKTLHDHLSKTKLIVEK
ncbi:MAG: RDD family protein [Pseudomonadota bacterium]|nr:RDD family protein [Pseudomonadota bacterium]